MGVGRPAGCCSGEAQLRQPGVEGENGRGAIVPAGTGCTGSSSQLPTSPVFAGNGLLGWPARRGSSCRGCCRFTCKAQRRSWRHTLWIALEMPRA